MAGKLVDQLTGMAREKFSPLADYAELKCPLQKFCTGQKVPF
jgi:hypothetical protein